MSTDPKLIKRTGIRAQDIREREVMMGLLMMRAQYEKFSATKRLLIALEVLLGGGAAYTRATLTDDPRGTVVRLSVSRDAEEKVHHGVLVLSDEQLERPAPSPYKRTVTYDFVVQGRV